MCGCTHCLGAAVHVHSALVVLPTERESSPPAIPFHSLPPTLPAIVATLDRRSFDWTVAGLPAFRPGAGMKAGGGEN